VQHVTKTKFYLLVSFFCRQAARAASSVDPYSPEGEDLEDLVERVEDGFVDEEEGSLIDNRSRFALRSVCSGDLVFSSMKGGMDFV